MTFDPNKHQNRVALTLSANHVLSIGFGSYCDQDSYHGWLMRFDVSTSPITRLVPFVTTPNTTRGALWQGGNGFADDGTGAIYIMGANGPHQTPVTRDSSGTSLGNAFVKITGTTSTTAAPTIKSWFMPSNFGTLDDGDLDIGSSGPLLIPGTTLIDGGGKGGLLYLLNNDTMGSFNAAGDTQGVQELQVAPGGTVGQIVGSPIFWNRGTAGHQHDVPLAGDDAARAVHVRHHHRVHATALASRLSTRRRTCRVGTCRCRPTERPAGPASSGPRTRLSSAAGGGGIGPGRASTPSTPRTSPASCGTRTW